MADLAAIQAKYPAYAYLLSDPEIGPLINEAVDSGMDTQTFQARLMATNWWKTNNQNQRTWSALWNTDPAEAQKQTNDRAAQVKATLAQMGMLVEEPLINEMVRWSLATGSDPNSAAFKGQLNWLRTQWGSPSAKTDQLKGIANNEYMVQVDNPTLDWWAGQIATGAQTEETFRHTMVVLASGRYPSIANLIQQGITPGNYFNPMRAQIAKEMDYASADQVDLMNDPRWSSVLQKVDTNGSLRPMTMSETITLARSQDEWKQTRNGQALGGQLTQQLLKTFGEIG